MFMWQCGYQILIISCKYAVKVAELMVTSLFAASVMFERTEIYLDADSRHWRLIRQSELPFTRMS